MKRKSIFVEISIETEMEDLWDASQQPHQHEQWDLRFTSITYLPKENESDPQHFSYKTNTGIGVVVEGWGKSAGEFNSKDGSRTSSLHFGTDQQISIISEGKGYWKYIPDESGKVTFLTQYDYDTRFGRLGALIDAAIFRPMIGWGTALSFDVLKRWLEKGESPASQYTRFISYWLITFMFSFVWMYQGLVPKIWLKHPEEVSMATSLLPEAIDASVVVFVMGIGEILFGLIWLFYRNRYWLFKFQMIAFPLLTLSAILAAPHALAHPFNPLIFNVSLFVLSVIGMKICRDIPTAKNCRRKR
ncbi:DoxX-like family protein [Pseudalkalibacillus hwajinpoensis]|uniref:DoxX-like family protein n=1 Tax=Guptibacillus hwajinpoensis TaxID=208199 RepID=UPI001CFDAC30|nr:DoxX-like family protein [Pseudalkalibacillus hwajinpoensis]